MKTSSSKINVCAEEQAIEQTARELETPPSKWPRPVFVFVPLHRIGTRLDLFPREQFAAGVPEADARKVDDLVARIAQNDTIDSPLVMKIGGQWVCVDGHHQIAAYRKLEPRRNIRCEWFNGTLREAADEHLRNMQRNAAILASLERESSTVSTKETMSAEDARARLLNALRYPLRNVVRAVSVQQGASTTEDRMPIDADMAETSSSLQSRIVVRPPSNQLLDQEELQAAIYATLRAHATSDAAKALVVKLAAMVEDHGIRTGSRKYRRKNTAGKLEYATGAFLANLLRPLGTEEPNGGWVYRSGHAKSFTGGAVSHRTFTQLVDGLTELGLLDHVDGHRVSSEPEDTGKFAARFRATPALLSLCTEQGVEPTAGPDHFEFEYDLPRRPIELRAEKVSSFYRDTKPVGRPMEFERTPTVETREGEVRELNEFFAKQTLRGGSHEGYIRIFHNGDDPYFDWNLGGRLYSQHFTESYQVFGKEARGRMTINGEPVGEIDIRASYLTIFLSLHGIQLDTTKDPYELPGLGQEHRDVVKAWMVATFGNTKPIRRWPPRMLENSPELKQYRVADITRAALAHYPVLQAWGTPLNGRVHGWADLMWLESAVMVSTMIELKRDHAIPSLSVHDSLIVPFSKVDTACKVLMVRFHTNFKRKAVPLLKTDKGPWKWPT
jgi:hypothetical protein